MEFGIFNAACVLPRYVEQHGASAEHDRIMDEVAFIVAADKAGFKYTWASEHHFLTEYSHLSASESFLAFVAAKTSNIHIGSGIFNITPPVNHPGPHRRAGGHARPPLGGPLRVRHRPRLVDHRAEGLRDRGLRAHPRDGGRDPAPDRAHVEGRGLQLRGQVLLHADPQRAAQALFEAPPAPLDGGGQPGHLRPGRRAGRGRPVLRLLDTGPADPAGEPLQGEDRGLREPGRRLREQQRDDHDPDDLHGGRGEGPQDLPRGGLELSPEPRVPLSRHLPRPPGIPEWPAIIPGLDADQLDAVIASGDIADRHPRRGGQGDRELRRDGRRSACRSACCRPQCRSSRARRPSRRSASTC